jgi:hypothetical protein
MNVHSKSKTYRVQLKSGALGAIPVPFDPVAVFGKARAPVRVELNGYSYRSTISSMGGSFWIPLRRSHREAARLEGTETVSVTLTLDEAARTVETPPDLVAALKRVRQGMAAWKALSFTHQREHVEAILGAKKEETRARRVVKAVEMAVAKGATRAGRPAATPSSASRSSAKRRAG